MTRKEEGQKENELLLNVLKDGLPYGLQLQITDVNGFTFNGELRVLSKNWCSLKIADSVKREKIKNETIPLNYIHIKPYLRPMSSMTETEIDEFTQFDVYANGEYIMSNYEMIDWLNKYHFDYRGLIEKGLAIEVTEENNPYKN